MAGKHIAVIGATGAVGRELVGILIENGLAPERIVATASRDSELRGPAWRIGVRALQPDLLAGAGLAFFAADCETSRGLAPLAAEYGAVVIDNSSAFRGDPRVSLIVPEVNGRELGGPDRIAGRIIASPNCSATILVMALEPIREAFGIESITLATYQAVSGAGAAAIEELKSQSRAVLAGETAEPRIFPEPCAFNVFSHDSPIDPRTGLNGEEAKIIAETRRIWSLPELHISPMCFRVPVVRSHTQAITVELQTPATEGELREILARGRGLRLIDDRAANRFPTPLGATGGDDVLVGRIRPDPSGNARRWSLIACGDQLRRGAALNAFQIARLTGRL